MRLAIEKALVNFRSKFALWMDLVAQAIVDLSERFASSRTVTMVENENGELLLRPGEEQNDHDMSLASEHTALQTGPIKAFNHNRINVLLRQDKFLFRQLELPNCATEFLDGIVRSQLERLMPWNVAKAAYGWSKPTESDNQRMVITIAATSTDTVKPIVNRFAEVGAQSICIFVISPDGDRIQIWDQKVQSYFQVDLIRRALVAIFLAVTFSAAIAVSGSIIVGLSLAAKQNELTSRITEARTTTARLLHTQLSRGKAIDDFIRRKKNAPAAVITIDRLSKILPDDTYVSELRIEGDKIRVTGITHDAPSLIEKMEKSGSFSRATFFAPTTSSPNATERFHIEAVIRPMT